MKGSSANKMSQDRIAIVDLGTNTFNLLVAELREGKLHVVHRKDLGVKLGQGGIENGAITPEAYQRGLNALHSFADEIKPFEVSRFSGLGTSMLRNASNGKQFIKDAKEQVNIDIRIIKGKDEAGFIVDGVRQAVEFTKKPALIMDIGGGSVEFVMASKDSILWKHSFEVGTTRLLERIGMSDPLSMEEQLRMSEHLNTQLGMLWGMMEKHHPSTLIGSAGSFDTLAELIARKRDDQEPSDASTSTFTPVEYCAIMDELLPMPRSERLSYPGLPEYRVDTMLPALLIIDAVLQHGIAKIHWSKYSMKEGAAWRELN